MNAEIQLGRRALAAGAPPIGTHAVYLGTRIMAVHTGLVYIRAGDSGELLHTETIPLLSDRSWPGWVLAEAESRGFWACLSTKGDWAVTRPGFSRTGGPGSRSEALVAILEATRTEEHLPASAQAGGAIRFTIGSGSAGEPGESTKLVLPPFTSGVIKLS